MRTFIVRLQQNADGSGRGGTASARLRGIVDEVATGLRATFRNDQELVAALKAAVGADLPGSSDGRDNPRWNGPVTDDSHSIDGEK